MRKCRVKRSGSCNAGLKGNIYSAFHMYAESCLIEFCTFGCVCYLGIDFLQEASVHLYEYQDPTIFMSHSSLRLNGHCSILSILRKYYNSQFNLYSCHGTDTLSHHSRQNSHQQTCKSQAQDQDNKEQTIQLQFQQHKRQLYFISQQHSRCSQTCYKVWPCNLIFSVSHQNYYTSCLSISFLFILSLRDTHN